jgi:hypothetical protein
MDQHQYSVGTLKLHTFPKISKGKPIYAIILFLLLVLKDDGFESVGALAARGGEPESSRVWRRPRG